jgi:hypothetical protein
VTDESMLGDVDPVRVRTWGNHNLKFLAALEQNHGALVTLVRSARLPVTLRGSPANAAAEMRAIAMASEPAVAQPLLGAYYAQHFLALNARLLDSMGERHRRGDPRPDVYRAVLRSLEEESFSLARAFVGACVALESELPPDRFVLCNVGAVWDHDDLDLWAVAERAEDLPRLGTLCGRLARASMRWAQRVHFYLSELLPRHAFAGTLADYREVLDRDLKNFVVVTQVLQAVPLAGSQELFGEMSRVLRARYVRAEPPAPQHEGFLRGALSEVQSLAGLPTRVRWIDPKAEIYRLVRVVLACQAARFGEIDGSPWGTLARVAALDRDRALQYEAMSRAFDFAEVLRYLYGLFYAQEAAIVPDDTGAREALSAVASYMGFGTADDPHAIARLFSEYAAHRAALRAAIKVFVEDLTRDLRSISVFHRMLTERTSTVAFDELEGNVARVLLRYAEAHPGYVFWEDLVGICVERPAALERWARDLARLRGRHFSWTLSRYTRLMQEDVARFVELLNLLRDGDDTQRGVADRLLDAALLLYARDEDALSRFTELFHTFPVLVARFVERASPESTARIVGLYRDRWTQRRYRKAGVRLLSLLNLYHFSSRNSQRHSTRVLARYPNAISFLDDFGELARIGETALGEALGQPAGAGRRARLRDFYDLEFCRLSLMTLGGLDERRVGYEFRRTSQRYVAALFESCVEEVAWTMGRPVPQSHVGFALFATGGNAREDPYDVDYDMFALLRDEVSRDAGRRRFYNRVLARLTRALTECGIVPHNRFTDRFGAYVASFAELRRFFASPPPDAFIERTELLGSRWIAGDPSLDADLDTHVITPLVFGDSHYPEELLSEIRARHEERTAREMEVKEAPGGLRDVQLFVSALKARARLRAPESPRLWTQLRAALPEVAPQLVELERATAFLKRIRDVYRLTVVGEDLLDPGYFGVVGLFMGYTDRAGTLSRALLRDYRAALARTRTALRACAERMGWPTESL